MTWNWQLPEWPHFKYDQEALDPLEAKFLHESGVLKGSLSHVNATDTLELTANLISDEALKSSAIEGEYLDRDSLQSSIRRQLGMQTDRRKVVPAEKGMADMVVDIHQHFDDALDHHALFRWHQMLMSGRYDLNAIGQYRTHEDPMQVVSGRIDRPKIHFEAPPSNTVPHEMKKFIAWFNNSRDKKQKSFPTLTHAGITHLYFVSVHPFEDGNGRIGRALSEKSLSQSLGYPSLVSLSHTIEKNKKAYYHALEGSNKKIKITDWLIYFSETILEAQKHTRKTVYFLIEKTKLHDRLRGKLNARQEKALGRMFQEGIDGFKDGLSAKNYTSITRASPSTATRDLNDLVEKGALYSTGELKKRRYHLNIQCHQD